LNVFVDLKITCEDTVKAWEFYASRTGTFFASVWRKEGNNIKLIGKNRIDVTKTGAQVSITVIHDKERSLHDVYLEIIVSNIYFDCVYSATAINF